MAGRRSSVSRKTKETKISATVNLDGSGRTAVHTRIPFLDHMLTLFGTHGACDLTVSARGDLKVDLHHTNEDVGQVLGTCLDRALGDRAGLARMGWAYVPMEEALARVVLDLSGRARLVIRDGRERREKPSFWSSASYQWGDAEHFLESMTRGARITLHVDLISGRDFHHSLEAVFKALGRAFRQAAARDARVRGVPSSKGRI
ncbi:MAG TPA: imidazoleglycerol-phosphate dehydratase [bacterium]